ncbi:hypothetical protein B296_00051128, partial [Ensete ventricosum]
VWHDLGTFCVHCYFGCPLPFPVSRNDFGYMLLVRIRHSAFCFTISSNSNLFLTNTYMREETPSSHAVEQRVEWYHIKTDVYIYQQAVCFRRSLQLFLSSIRFALCPSILGQNNLLFVSYWTRHHLIPVE